MTNRIIKIPNTDHPITIALNPKRVLVMLGDKVLADTRHALTLLEANYGPVHYIPGADLSVAALTPSKTRTYYPYKGEVSYYSISEGGERSLDAVWSYEEPHESVAVIKDHVAFYPNRVGAIDERDG